MNPKVFYNCIFENIKHICEDYTIVSLEETRGREPSERWCKESQTRAGGERRQWGRSLRWKWSFRKHGGGGGQLSRGWTLASFSPCSQGLGKPVSQVHVSHLEPVWIVWVVTLIKTMRLYRKQFGIEYRVSHWPVEPMYLLQVPLQLNVWENT